MHARALQESCTSLLCGIALAVHLAGCRGTIDLPDTTAATDPPDTVVQTHGAVPLDTAAIAPRRDSLTAPVSTDTNAVHPDSGPASGGDSAATAKTDAPGASGSAKKRAAGADGDSIAVATRTDSNATALPAGPPRLVALRLVAATPSIEVDATVPVSAVGVMSDSSRVTSWSEPVTWSATGGAVNAAGAFTAGDLAGAASVTASVAGMTGTVAITVTDLPISTTFDAIAADDFVNSVGINIHAGYFNTPYGPLWESAVVPRLSELGIRHVRDAGVVVSDDNWMRTVYGHLNELARAGIRTDLVMRPAEGTTDYTALPQFSRLMSFAGGAVEAFEGLNEHDLSGSAAWVTETASFQAALAAAVRGNAQTKALPIFGPSFGHPANAAAVGDLGAWLDDANLHPYPGGQMPLAALASQQQLTAAVFGRKPWVVTETGYHTALGAAGSHPGVSEAAMARYVPRLLIDNYLSGIARSYLYELLDEGTDPANREDHFGLLRADGSPKPAFTAVKDLLAILQDAGGHFAPSALPMELQGNLTGISHAVFAKRGGTWFVVLWQEVSSFDQATKATLSPAARDVTLRFRGGPTLSVYDPLQSASPIGAPKRANTITVAVPDSPIIVEVAP